jgi:hypothetical protein
MGDDAVVARRGASTDTGLAIEDEIVAFVHVIIMHEHCHRDAMISACQVGYPTNPSWMLG